MKQKLLLLTSVLILHGTAHAQWVVTDPGVLAETVLHTTLQRDHLTLSRDVINRLGNAAGLQQVPGAAAVLQSLGNSSAERSSSTTPCTGYGALAYDGGQVYRAIGEFVTAPDGSTVQRQLDRYKPFEAAQRTTAQYLAVVRETEERRTALLQGIRQTTEAIQTAKDLAEVQKLQAVASTQVAALNAIDGERASALGAALVQSLDNNADAARQTEARREDRAVEAQAGFARAQTFLTPVSSTVTIRRSRQ
ncbi:MAG: hypothetical protein IPK15_13385 [Verrucomicrobia bacterium]|nr:hypothetical protein [Verrucomicrobiota bacterium]